MLYPLKQPPHMSNFVQVQQLTEDHGKKWKAKEYGYNPRVAEKKGVIIKRIKEYIQAYQCQPEQVLLLPCHLGSFHM